MPDTDGTGRHGSRPTEAPKGDAWGKPRHGLRLHEGLDQGPGRAISATTTSTSGARMP